MNLKIKKGLEANLPQQLEKDAIYVTTDTKKIRLNDCVWEDANNLKNYIDENINSLSSIVEEDSLVTASALNDLYKKKVNAVEGKQLSTEDFTTLLKEKLENLTNYDDTSINELVTSLQNQFDTLVNGNPTKAIENFNEIIAFLNGIEDSENLDGIIASIEQQIAGKQNEITDLETIRSGANQGATAVQPSDLHAVAKSGDYNDLTNKPTIPNAVTESIVSGWGFTKNTGTYIKPNDGIPKTDLESDVQTSLENANNAIEMVNTLSETVNEIDDHVYEIEEVMAAAFNELNDKINEPNDILTGLMLDITYDELATLQKNNELIPNMKYRITDYVTTTSQENTKSANHQFDIIVEALTENTFNHQAKACLRTGDDYFSTYGAKLEAWQIWYDFNGDSTKYKWAGGDASYDSSSVNIDESLVDGETFITPFVPDYYIFVDVTKNDYKESDMFYEYGRETNPDGLDDQLCIYKSDIDYYEDEGADYEDKFFYYGIETVDGVEYDKWRKAEDQTWYEDSGGYGGGALFILTQRITSNPEDVIVNGGGGTGVIYRMIDEWGNDCPYDFKNIMFYRNREDYDFLNKFENDWFYTFSIKDENDATVDLSIRPEACSDEQFAYGTHHNTMKPAYEEGPYPTQILNNNIFANPWFNEYYGCYSNKFGVNCHSNTFGASCSCNKFGDSCYNNTFGDECDRNTFGNDCYNNTFGDECDRNTFGEYCYDNTFGGDCYDNTFGNDCYNNTFGDECDGNTFGASCSCNKFGDSCYNNTFVEYCYNNTFGNNCYSNSFGEECNFNSFGEECYNNKFGEYCNYNSFGEYCNYNSFGDFCFSNSFGNDCFKNSFGNECYDNSFDNNCTSNSFDNDCYDNSFDEECKNNTFGEYCYDNTFGDGCESNTFGNLCYFNTFGEYCYDNTFGGDCYRIGFYNSNACHKGEDDDYIYDGEVISYITNITLNNNCNNILFYNDSLTIDDTNKIQNISVKSGVKSLELDDSNVVKPLTIELVETNNEFDITIARNSNGDIKIYCEADLIK